MVDRQHDARVLSCKHGRGEKRFGIGRSDGLPLGSRVGPGRGTKAPVRGKAAVVNTEIEMEGFPDIREEEGKFQDYPGFEWFLSVLPYNLSLVETNIRIVRVLIVWNDGNDEFEVSTAISN